jgi:Na+/H+ antiporter NhaD/arsenite permease-like protein
MDLGLGPLVNVPYKRGLAIFAGMISFIAMHHYLERGLGLGPNTVLIVAPLVIAGLLMLWRHQRARHYIESIDWWTLLFFMMLFAKAGTLQETHVTEKIAGYFQQVFGNRLSVLTPAVIGSSALGSAFVDNIVFAAAFMPVVNKLQQTPLIWALLQGTCLGGNITMIGSTANIIALGMLEKRYRTSIKFFEWLKVGLVVGIVSCLIAWGGIAVLSPYMPTREQRGLEAVERMKHDGIEHMPVVVSQQSKEYAGVLESHAMHRQRSAEVISK